MPNDSPVAIAILAKAPIPGLAKTRLIPAIGAHAAAVLQERLTERAVETARRRRYRPGDAVVRARLRATPRSAIWRGAFRIALKRQPDGDLGARMLGAIAAQNGPTLVIGTDCPALTVGAFARGGRRRLDDADVVLIPAEDGGYVLIGARARAPAIVRRHRLGHVDGARRDARAHRRARPQSVELAAAVGRRHRSRPRALRAEFPELAL